MRRIAQTLMCLALLAAGCASPPPDREIISVGKAPGAIGPYSQAVRVGPTIYLSGQIAIDPATQKMVEGGIAEQTHQVLKNIGAVLEAAGYTLADVVRSHVYLSDLENYAEMNAVYATYFQDAPPARAAVQAARLPRDALVEIMVTAVKSR